MARPLVLSCIAIVVLATAGLPVRAGGPAQDASSAALLAKHLAYVGWQFGDGTFASMRISGSVTDEKGEKTQTFVLLSKGLLYHNTYTFLKSANSTVHSGYTGNLFWLADSNGFPTPIYGDYAKYLASFSVLQQEGTRNSRRDS